MRLSLDHLTAVDMLPPDLARIAAQTGCAGICLFLSSMPVLPRMPQFDLVSDRMARGRTREVCRDLGVAVDLAYPFTLSGRTVPSDFAPALDAAAELGAACVNALLYDREPARRQDNFSSFCALADARGLKVAVEFYPPSQVRTLEAALALVAATGPAEKVGITVDLLHLVRSGGQVEDLARLPSERIRVAQLCDGPKIAKEGGLEEEAASARLLPGEGAFDVAGFIRSVPSSARLTLEVPRENALKRGVPAEIRVLWAVDAARRVIVAAGP